MGFSWNTDLPGNGRLLSSVPRPFSHVTEWLAQRWRGWRR